MEMEVNPKPSDETFTMRVSYSDSYGLIRIKLSDFLQQPLPSMQFLNDKTLKIITLDFYDSSEQDIDNSNILDWEITHITESYIEI